jgi:nucleotide-binding universal stress UspA family protein
MKNEMFGKILVPLDGSELAERALQPAMELAAANAAELFLLSAAGLKDMVVPSADAYGVLWPEQSQERYHSELESYLGSITREQIPAGVGNVRSLVLDGDPAATIVDTAFMEDVELIVMSTHGRSGLGRWMFGSTTEKVLRAAPCPVMVVREPQPVRRVLITLDGSRLAERALEPGLAVARALDAEITLLHVEEHLGDVDPYFVSELEQAEAGLGEQYRLDYYYRAQHYLDEVALCLQEPALDIRTRVADGPAAQSILAFIEQEAIDVCVMATHGRSGLRRWVYGSVTEKVLRATKSAMMIVRPPRGDLN